MKKVMFLIRSINIGGAEKQLLTLLRGLDRSRIDPVVVTFYPDGELLSEYLNSGVRVISAGKRGRWDILPFISNLSGIILNEKPDVIMSYLVAANLLAMLLKPFTPRIKLIISIRHSYVRNEDYDTLNRVIYFLQDKLAWLSDQILVNSYTGARMAAERGMPQDKMVVIPNGIDTTQFRADINARRRTRKELGISETAMVTGIIGRIDPIKDHETFIKAASIVLKTKPDMVFLVVGSGSPQFESELRSTTRSLGIESSFKWVASQKDVQGIYNVLDMCVSASIGEGFSNVIAEAMACEVPCVVSDVGDSRRIVGETGMVFAPGDVQGLAARIQHLATLPPQDRSSLGRAAREKIVKEFSLEKMVEATSKEILK